MFAKSRADSDQDQVDFRKPGPVLNMRLINMLKRVPARVEKWIAKNFELAKFSKVNRTGPAKV